MKTKRFHKSRLIFSYYILFCGILFSGCSKYAVSESSMIGNYKSKQFNIIQVGYYQYVLRKITIKGNDLTILKDSTFVYSTCGNEISGYYQISSDTLRLYCLTNKNKKDSVIYKTISPFDTIFYQIRDNNNLVSERVLSNGNFKGFIQQDFLTRER